MEEYRNLIRAEVRKLFDELQQLNSLIGKKDRVRPPEWEIVNGVRLVKLSSGIAVCCHGCLSSSISRVFEEVTAGCELPGDYLRVVRRLQRAQAWCRARQEGLHRHHEEMMRQQRRAIEALELECTLHRL